MKKIITLISFILIAIVSYSQDRVLLEHVNVDANNVVSGGERSNIVIYTGQPIPPNYVVIGTGATGIVDWAIKAEPSVDFISTQKEIATLVFTIANPDLSNWDTLSAKQKAVALSYMPNEIMAIKGQTWFGTECFIAGCNVETIIKNYRKNALESRQKRFEALTGYTQEKLGATQALQAIDPADVQVLIPKYTNYGAIYQADFGINALGDWITSVGPYNSTGLKKQLELGNYTLLDPTVTVNDFIDQLIFILEKGYK